MGILSFSHRFGPITLTTIFIIINMVSTREYAFCELFLMLMPLKEQTLVTTNGGRRNPRSAYGRASIPVSNSLFQVSGPFLLIHIISFSIFFAKKIAVPNRIGLYVKQWITDSRNFDRRLVPKPCSFCWRRSFVGTSRLISPPTLL